MKKKQRIVHIVPTFDAGGAERLVLEYATHLDKNAYEVYVASCVRSGALEQLLRDTGVEVFNASRAQYGGRLGAWRALKKFLDDVQPDIIHSHLISSDVSAYLYKRKHPQVTWVSTLHNVEHNRPWWYHKVWQYILPKADQVVAVAPVVAQYAIDAFKLQKADVDIVLNGIDTKKWRKTSQAPVFASQTVHIATIGRFEEQKGHTYLLDALSKIQDSDWQYHTFGDGSLRAELEAQAKQLGIFERITWHGVVHDLPEQLTHIDVVVQPSLWEGLSLTVMEAMAAGRVLVASSTAAATLVEHDKTGYVFPVQDVEALKEILLDIVDKRAHAQDIARAGHTYAMDTFSLDTHMASLIKEYTSS